MEVGRITHLVATGMTESGKSAVLKQIAASVRESSVKVAVYDPRLGAHRGPGLGGWPADMVCGSWPDFKALLCRSRGLFAVIDEAHRIKAQDPTGLDMLLMMGRHVMAEGGGCHTIALAAPRYLDALSPTARDMCSHVYAFKQSERDARMIAEDWAIPELQTEIPKLKPLHYIAAAKHGGWGRGVLKF